jgi:hypothetical protein
MFAPKIGLRDYPISRRFAERQPDVMATSPKLRLAVIANLAEKLSGKLGRTAIMKLTFFLQELRGVPLGYSYRIYTYGPYDGQVLTDLKVAESIGAVQTEQFEWDGGSGYTIKAGKKPTMSVDDQKLLSSFLNDIEWVANEFGDLSASDLEVESTVFFVAKSAEREKQNVSSEAIARAVRAIKPHHSEARILKHIERLQQRGLIALAAAA